MDSDGDGFSTCAGDCNDNTAGVYPGATEVPNDGIDQNCSGSDSTPTPDDLDGDGFTSDDGDCNDNNPGIYPGPWYCDGFNNDCINGSDDNDPNVVTSTQIVFFSDEDGDGYYGTQDQACTVPDDVSLVNR